MNDHELHFFCCCSVAVNCKVKFLQKYKFLITEKYFCQKSYASFLNINVSWEIDS